MRAAVIPQWGQPSKSPKFTPEPGPGDVRVRISGSGACHSDLHVKGGELGDPGFTEGRPKILGHENAGGLTPSARALPDWTSASRWRCSVVGVADAAGSASAETSNSATPCCGAGWGEPADTPNTSLFPLRVAAASPAPGPAAGQVRRNTVRGLVSGVRSTVDVR